MVSTAILNCWHYGWNDWLSVNVAVPGLALTWNKFRWLAPEEADKGLARLGDLATDHSLMILTIMLGTNDCGMGKENEVGHPLAALLDSFRQTSLPRPNRNHNSNRGLL